MIDGVVIIIKETLILRQGIAEGRGQAALLAQHPVHRREGRGEDGPQSPLLPRPAEPEHSGPKVSPTHISWR